MSRFNGKRAEFEASGEKINVAILGAGRIAHTMAGTLTQMAEDSLYSSWIHPYAVRIRKALNPRLLPSRSCGRTY